MKRLMIMLVAVVALGCGGKTKEPATSNTTQGAGTSAECAADACGPAPGMPAINCTDGTKAGNTGRCVRNAEGTCGWEITECPSGTAP